MKTLNPSPGKFEGNDSQLVARVAYEASLDGCAETIGDCSEIGWHASLVTGKRYSFIVYEDDLGFVDVETFRNGDPALASNWALLWNCADDATGYAQAFGLPSPNIDYASDEAKKTRDEEAARFRALSHTERLAEWVAGNGYACGVRSNDGSALLRIKGNTVETSQGVSVPLEDARRAYRAVEHCHNTGTGWESNGETLPVGVFKVDRIDSQGNVWAGCHFIAWDVVEAFGRLASEIEPETQEA